MSMEGPGKTVSNIFFAFELQVLCSVAKEWIKFHSLVVLLCFVSTSYSDGFNLSRVKALRDSRTIAFFLSLSFPPLLRSHLSMVRTSDVRSELRAPDEQGRRVKQKIQDTTRIQQQYLNFTVTCSCWLFISYVTLL